jgi:hypothetical protein
MTLEQEFDKRIAAIYGLNNQDDGSNDTRDIRHAEFQAMADVFLGEDFDRRKLEHVERLQRAFHEQQVVLYQRYKAEELNPEEYVESFNTLLDNTFTQCEDILGKKNFRKLFGAPRSELGGFIDKDAFLQAHQRKGDK